MSGATKSLQLIWNGMLYTVAIPHDIRHLGAKAAWAFAQRSIVGGSYEDAMKEAIAIAYPGVGWDKHITLRPVFAGDAEYDEGAFSAIDTSSHSAPASSPIQTRSSPSAATAASHGESHTVGTNTRPPPPATSTATRHRDPSGAAAERRQHGPRPVATPRTGGWMGTAPTNA